MTETAETRAEALWWQSGTIYQIYPRSFQDSDGDGTGDLGGVIDRLEYLAWLGIDAIWLSPIFPSPMADFGYDVSDYCAIHPLFGSMQTFDRLVAEAHHRGIRVVLDFVPNHTSDQHPWFQQSRSSRVSPRRDWYLWRDPGEDGGPPNNWLANFGGPAWTWDERTGQYYLHTYLPQQPDLNWRNPEVESAMFDVLRFWLDRGVDGFRVDVIWRLMKDREFRDNPVNPAFEPSMRPHMSLLPVYSANRPEVHELLARMRGVLDEYDERMLIGEINLPVDQLLRYYGESGEEVHLPFNFQLLRLPWEAGRLGQAIAEYHSALPVFAWPNWVVGNHDRPRVASRVGRAQARVAVMLLLTLRGTPTLYYGDEIGMTNVDIPPEQAQDPLARRIPGQGFGRDPARTPMQWDGSPNAGFTTADPWLPVAPDFAAVNVEREAADPYSMLTLHRLLLEIRRDPALSIGRYEPVAAEGDLLAYRREHGSSRYLVALNLGEADQQFTAPGALDGAAVVLSTELDREGPAGAVLALRPNEGLLVRLPAADET